MKKVTSRDVARMAGVSQSAVSMILNNKENISFSFETRERVFEAARALNYRVPARSASRTGEEGLPLIAVFTPTLFNPYYIQLLQTIECNAREKGYKVIFCNTARIREQENYYLDLCGRSRVSGIIFTFVPSFPKRVEQLALSIPVILIGEKEASMTLPSLELNNVHAATVVADHLLELGHRSFAIISSPRNHWTLARAQRVQGIRDRLEHSGYACQLFIQEADEFQENDEDEAPYEYSVGYSLTLKLMGEHPEVTALVGTNDMIALGILAALEQLHIHVPEQVSVCGFDNIFDTRISCPKLTTVDHYLSLRAASAVEFIIARNSGSPVYQEVNKIEYQPRLIIRDSTGPCQTGN